MVKKTLKNDLFPDIFHISFENKQKRAKLTLCFFVIKE